MSFEIKQDIMDSVEDIDELLASYEILIRTTKQKEPDNIELAALGTVLHSFYNGVEGIFLNIVKHVDKSVPNGFAWHQTLLRQVTEETDNRIPVITEQTADILAPYIKFRHFFRHAYAFMLDWQRMKPLVDELNLVWNALKRELESFSNTIST